jgi:hypothetical protein
MDASPPRRPNRPVSFLDRPAARLLALGVVVLVVVALGYIHWEDMFPGEAGGAAADDPAAPCIAQRTADIEAMRAEGTISDEQARLFTTRAEALCRAQAGQAGAPPPMTDQ